MYRALENKDFHDGGVHAFLCYYKNDSSTCTQVNELNPASMAILYAINVIRQQSDYVTGVKDRWWASNRIMLEFDWTVHNSEWRAV